MMGVGKPKTSFCRLMMMLFLRALMNALRENSFSKISSPTHGEAMYPLKTL